MRLLVELVSVRDSVGYGRQRQSYGLRGVELELAAVSEEGGPDAESGIATAEMWSAKSAPRCYSFKCRPARTCSKTMLRLLGEQSDVYSLLIMRSEC